MHTNNSTYPDSTAILWQRKDSATVNWFRNILDKARLRWSNGSLPKNNPNRFHAKDIDEPIVKNLCIR